jgi:thiamine-phosphate pyrophosphorylase
MDLGVYLVTAEPAGGATIDIVLAAVAGGVRTVQLRDKSGDTGRLVELLTDLHDQLRGSGTTLIANDDVEAAIAVPGVGVHVGPDDLHPTDARRLLGDQVCIGWSIHDLDQLADADALDACDYVAASPVWPTPTKTDTTAPWGLDGVRRLRSLVPAGTPLVGIGGIDAGNAAEVIRAGADGVAVVSAICSAPDPKGAAAELRAAVDTALTHRKGGS